MGGIAVRFWVKLYAEFLEDHKLRRLADLKAAGLI